MQGWKPAQLPLQVAAHSTAFELTQVQDARCEVGSGVDQLSRSRLDAGESSIQSGMVALRRLVLIAVLSVATRVLCRPKSFDFRISRLPVLHLARFR